MSDEREEIRRRINLVDLIGERVALKKAGRDWKGLCPFHDDRNPSFTVNAELGRYRCWSCGAKGDIFDWVMETQKVEFGEALGILAKEAGVELKNRGEGKKERELKDLQEAAMEAAQKFFLEQFEKSPIAKEYVAKRGLDKDVLEAWEIGYAPDIGEALAMYLGKHGFNLGMCQELFLVQQDSRGGFYDRFRGRLMFPIRDERGRLVAFGGRILGEGQPKYINSSDTPLYRKSRVLYGMHRAKETVASEGRAVLVEGYMDVIACHRAGLITAVANLGTALAEDQVKLLKRWCGEAVVLYDSDPAGQKAAGRSCEVLVEGGMRAKVAVMEDGEDPDTLLESGGPEAVKKVVMEPMSPMEFRFWSLRKRLGPESDEYWSEVVEVLAAAETPLELEKYLLPVAAEYPGSKDPVASRRALEKMVVAFRRDQKRKERERPQFNDGDREGERVARPGGARIPKLGGPEKVVFRALLSGLFGKAAWEAASDGEMMTTSVGTRMAEELEKSFEAEGPRGEAAEWLNQVDNEAAKGALVDLALMDEEPVTEENFWEAVDRLKKAREERDFKKARLTEGDSADLVALHERLRRMKGSED